jgi:hypothetical protein
VKEHFILSLPFPFSLRIPYRNRHFRFLFATTLIIVHDLLGFLLRRIGVWWWVRMCPLKEDIYFGILYITMLVLRLLDRLLSIASRKLHATKLTRHINNTYVIVFIELNSSFICSCEYIVANLHEVITRRSCLRPRCRIVPSPLHSPCLSDAKMSRQLVAIALANSPSSQPPYSSQVPESRITCPSLIILCNVESLDIGRCSNSYST